MTTLYYYTNADGEDIARVVSEEAWDAVRRLMGMPTLPERKLDFKKTPVHERLIERLSQWEEIERVVDKEMKAAIAKETQLEEWAAKQPSTATPQQRNLRGDEHWPYDIELYGRIRC